MLQPSQLTTVSLHYAEDVAELREFLVNAGCTLGTRQTLGAIADRLVRDRAFHRDLTSYVWVVIDRRDPIPYPHLLGMLAIAAVGPELAAEADEDDAHRLLRFLMDARHSLDSLTGSPDQAHPIAVADTAIATGLPPAAHLHQHNPEPTLLRPVEREVPLARAAEYGSNGRKRLGWVIAAVCLLVAGLTGLWLKSRPAPDTKATTPPATPGIQANAAPAPDTNQPVTPTPSHPEDVAGEAATPPPRSTSRSTPRRRPAPSARPTQKAARAIPSPAPSAPAPAASAVAHNSAPSPPPAPATTRPSPSVNPAPPAARTTLPPNPAPATAPVGTASAPPVPQASAPRGGDSLSRSSQPSIVLRRRVPGSASSDDGSDVASVAVPAGVTAAPGPSGSASAAPPHLGSVHATSLGSMASNLVYSPLPTYPAAAYASHVQGEVKVSADVDRSGRVASVRVISGPPLLRDAALDAVQRWRYRPYESSGGPIPMGAIEILDFQLP